MENFNAKEYWKRFSRKHYALWAVCCFLFALGIFLGVYLNSPTYYWICAAAYFIFLTVVRKHSFIVLLNKDFEPVHYAAVLKESGGVSKHGVEQLHAAYYMGDLQKAIDLSVYGLKNMPKNVLKKWGHWYYLTLARSYFALGDNEALGQVCQAYEKSLAQTPNSEKIRRAFTVMDFFALYAAGDLDACEAHYQKLPLPKLKDQRDRIFMQIGIDFNMAVVAYEKGNIESATELFKSVIAAAPHMVYAIFAEKYLWAIERGETVAHEKLVPSESFVYPSRKREKKRAALLCMIAITAFILAFFAALILKPTALKIFKGVTPYTTRAEMAELYGEPTKDVIGRDMHKYEFMGIAGSLYVTYDSDEDRISHVGFLLEAKNFENQEEFEKILDKAISHFDRVLFGIFSYSSDETDETYRWQSGDMYYIVNIYNNGAYAYFSAVPKYVFDDLYDAVNDICDSYFP